MSKENPLGTMCLATDLTTGIECELRRRLGRNCKKPSLAHQAKGEHPTKTGLQNSRFWQCIPALIYKAHQQTDNLPTFNETVAAQTECDSFIARK